MKAISASLCALLVVSCALPLSAENYSRGRRSLDSLYQNLQSTAPTGATRFSPACTVDNVPVVGCVKVWAVIANRQGQEISGPVNMRLHKWQPEERFYLYFQSATPIMVSLYQLYPETGHPNAGETRLVLPDQRYPRSFEALRPGVAVRMPILMKMDRTRVDEEMGIAIQCLNLQNIPLTGNSILDDPPCGTCADINQPGMATRSLDFARKAGNLGFYGNQAGRFSPAVISQPVTNDDYPIILCNRTHISFTKITLHKD